MTEPPLEEEMYTLWRRSGSTQFLLRLREVLKKKEVEEEDRLLEEHYFECMMEDDEREWAIAQMADEGTYFEPQEYK